MKTQEQVAVSGDFTLGAWNDAAMRENLWASLRQKAAGLAAREVKVLTGTPETRSGAMFMRLTDAPELAEVETDREHATFVRLRLSCWAAEQ